MGIFSFLRVKEEASDNKEKYTYKNVLEYVENNITNMNQSTIDDLGRTQEEIASARNRKLLFKKQLNLCGLGDLSSKNFIKSWMKDLITQKFGVNQENINYIMNYDFPDNYTKYCIILNHYKKLYKYDGLKKLIKNNNLDKLKMIDNDLMYAITNDDIDTIYERESYGGFSLSFEDKLEILVQRIYEQTNGLSVIDELRDMHVDEINIGTSGVPVSFISKVSDMSVRAGIQLKFPFSYESVWIVFEGKNMLMKYLTFGSQRQLERVCRKLYRFNNTKQFTQGDGYIFNNMADFSRVSVYRPPFAESWAAFIRRFDVDGDLYTLINGVNSDKVIKLIRYMIKAKETICFSGQQGAGKTTMLIAAIKELYADNTVRLWETYFETFLRFRLPNRNILTLRETSEISGEKALDSGKKTSGQVTVISEAADDESKTYIVKSALAASECVYWTDHSETADDVVQNHRNACLNTGAFRDELKAEEQVLSILKWDIHLVKEQDGFRHIDRITEFIRTDQEEFIKDAGQDAYYDNSRMYYEKRTNVKKYKSVNIVEYDYINKRYMFPNKISDDALKRIIRKLRISDQSDFMELMRVLEGVI